MTRSGAACGSSASQRPARSSSATAGSRKAVLRRSEPSAVGRGHRRHRVDAERREPRRREGRRGGQPGDAAAGDENVDPSGSRRHAAPGRRRDRRSRGGRGDAPPARPAARPARSASRARGARRGCGGRPRTSRRASGASPSSPKTVGEGRRLRLRHVGRVLEAVETVEGAVEPDRRRHPPRMLARAVGVDDLPPGQPPDRVAERRVRRHRGQVDVVDLGEVGLGVDPMLAASARRASCRAAPSRAAASRCGLGLVDARARA